MKRTKKRCSILLVLALLLTVWSGCSTADQADSLSSSDFQMKTSQISATPAEPEQSSKDISSASTQEAEPTPEPMMVVSEEPAAMQMFVCIPDHLCMKQPAVGSAGGYIVCLPNRVVIQGEGDSDSQDSESGFDAVV